MKQFRQIEFLRHIQQTVQSNIAFVNELSDLLEISSDSAYRRLRGETSLTFDEIIKICTTYHVSFDEFIASPGVHIVPFRYHALEGSMANVKAYFLGLNQEMARVTDAQTKNKNMLYAGQGLPIFHYFKFPLLSAFKMFYWMKSIVNVPELQFEVFSRNVIDEELVGLGKQIFEQYVQIPSTEIWVDSTAMGSLHQIQFYWDAGMFESADVALQVCEDFRSLLLFVQRVCETGTKVDDFENPTITGEQLKLYYSEIELEKISVLVRVGPTRRVYLDQLTFGSIYTEHRDYYNETENWLNSIIRKSNLISEVSQTMRYQFFNRSLKKLQKLEEHIKSN